MEYDCSPTFKCDVCKTEFGDRRLHEEEECLEKRTVIGKRILGKNICLDCLKNNPDALKITQTLLDSSETIYVVL